ncbi:GTP-binding protein Rhes isoform X1 [Dendroctonus ponderosae]|uniref:GTP-binding protein Rhes isoform X1 n=1 Tax=Dendroctonus ponderosae TaxID=77166 RepID=UPI0020358083|nr:GTP-binding protein Rhes isoform X1 [Dendroctonus ponderosae]
MNFSSCFTCFGTTTQNGKPVSNPKLTSNEQIRVTNPGSQCNSTAGTSSCSDSALASKNCYRLVMLGAARSGKTSLVSRFLGGKFYDSYTPTIENFHRKIYKIRGETYQLDILDTSGNHPFPAMRRLSFLTGELFVIVFSLDSRGSFDEAKKLRKEIIETKQNASNAKSGGSQKGKKCKPPIPMVFAGNKCDKEMRTVSADEVQMYCNSQGSYCTFVETSAKKNYQVDEVFYQLFAIATLPTEMAPNHQKRIDDIKVILNLDHFPRKVQNRKSRNAQRTNPRPIRCYVFACFNEHYFYSDVDHPLINVFCGRNSFVRDYGLRSFLCSTKLQILNQLTTCSSHLDKS